MFLGLSHSSSCLWPLESEEAQHKRRPLPAGSNVARKLDEKWQTRRVFSIPSAEHGCFPRGENMMAESLSGEEYQAGLVGLTGSHAT